MSVSRYLLLPIALFVAAAQLAAQESQHDSKGTKFWVAFLENFGSDGDGELSDLRLYAACEKPTSVRLRYNATGIEQSVTIPQANLPTEIDVRALFGDYVELMGSEQISRKSITVTSDEEITLYGVNVRKMSADAFLSLPDDLLTGRYIVLAYQNGITSSQGFGNIDMPSQFCVIATEDGTTVTITPSAPITGRGVLPYTIMLDEGEVHFGQATLDGFWDVSGTTVQATKPVAVYSGNRRTSIPSEIGNFRDHLVEQMPPIEVWGKEAIVTPHYPIAPYSDEVAVYRVLAATDNTAWSIDGVEQPRLMAASPVELKLEQAARIVAERPIIVAQYEHSVNADDPLVGEYGLGDPFMMLVPPPEQFDTAYAFQSVSHPEFLRHFINIVIPREGIGSLRLDGAPVNAPFVSIPGTRFGYVQHELGAGAHRIRSDSAFGLFAYGYGRANSYGYTGGMAYRQFIHDYLPPNLAQIVECGRIRGVVSDGRITDTGIDSVIVGPETMNMSVAIESFAPAPDSVHYEASLLDPFADGMLAIRAVDSVGRSRTQITPVPGFTVRASQGDNGGAVKLDTLSLFNGAINCRTFEVVNYGRYRQTVSDVKFVPALSSFSLSTTLPIVLEPGERRIVKFCATSAVDTIIDVDVVATTGCVDRRVAFVTIASGTDTLGPRREMDGDLCGNDLTLRFREPGTGISGITGITFTQLVNCRLAAEPAPFTVPLREAERRITIIDPKRDAFIAGITQDYVGNVALFYDTIPGFTCAVVDRAGDTVSLAIGRDWRSDAMTIGGKRCDSMTVVNYGVRTLRITRAYLAQNVEAGIPAAQFPIVLAPGERKLLYVCLDASATGPLDDTLSLLDDCGRVDRVALRAPVHGLQAVGGDRCSTALSVRSMGASKRTFLATPVPNPSTGLVTIDIGLSADDVIALELVDANGRVAHTIMRGEPLAGGLHRIVADLGALESGRYYLRLAGTTGVAVEGAAVVR